MAYFATPVNFSFNPKNNGRLMALGNFVFELATLPFQQIERQNSWKHPGSEPVGADPTYQYTGPGAETRSFSGVIYKEFSNPKSLDTLRDMADTGEAFALVGVTGKIFGFYVIDDVTETQMYFDENAEPRRVEFVVKLIRGKAANRTNNALNTTAPEDSKSTKA